MTNKEIYSQTIGFSIRKLIFDLLCIILLVGLCVAGFFVAEKAASKGLWGLGIGFIVGIILVAILARLISYTFKAGQIAMMTYGITEEELPENVFAEGKKIVKSRFATVAAYYAITGAIRGIFQQLGQFLTRLGRSVGGKTGQAVSDVINSAVQTFINYLSDCCLGWVFYREDESAGRATLEGAAIFFKHGKALAKNAGRVAVMSLVSLIVIGGIFFVPAFLILRNFPDAFDALSREVQQAIANGSDIPAFLAEPKYLLIAAAVLCALIIWSFLHTNFVRPFILVGVLRNYLESGAGDIPTDADINNLDSKSSKFAKFHQKVQ